MRETGGLGGDSCGDLGFEGNRPRRPFRESVLTTCPAIDNHYSLRVDDSDVTR